MKRELEFKSKDGTLFVLYWDQSGIHVTKVEVYMPRPDIFLERTAPSLNQFKSPFSPYSFTIAIIPNLKDNKQTSVFITEQTEQLIVSRTI